MLCLLLRNKEGYIIGIKIVCYSWGALLRIFLRKTFVAGSVNFAEIDCTGRDVNDIKVSKPQIDPFESSSSTKSFCQVAQSLKALGDLDDAAFMGPNSLCFFMF